MKAIVGNHERFIRSNFRSDSFVRENPLIKQQSFEIVSFGFQFWLPFISILRYFLVLE